MAKIRMERLAEELKKTVSAVIFDMKDPRIPTVTIPLEKAMDAILAASGPSVFLLDTVRSPDRLDLTIDDASWSGNRVATPAKK